MSFRSPSFESQPLLGEGEGNGYSQHYPTKSMYYTIPYEGDALQSTSHLENGPTTTHRPSGAVGYVRWLFQNLYVYHAFKILTHMLVLFNALLSSIVLFFEYYQIDLPILLPWGQASSASLDSGGTAHIPIPTVPGDGSPLTSLNMTTPFLQSTPTPLYGFPLTSLTFESCVIYTLLTLCSIGLYCYLTYYYYKREEYFPYTGSPHWLFIHRRISFASPEIPNHTLFFSQKITLLSLGFIFAVLPFSTLLRNILVTRLLNQLFHGKDSPRISSSLTSGSIPEIPSFMQHMYKMHTILLIIQLCVTFYDWILFLALYVLFLVEICLRFFCFPCCLVRSRHNLTPVPSDKHCLASSYSDPVFYKPYEWLYKLM